MPTGPPAFYRPIAMIDSVSLERWLHNPSEVGERIVDVVLAVGDPAYDEAIITDILESCGPTTDSAVRDLLARFENLSADQQFWTVTLIGRAPVQASSVASRLIAIVIDRSRTDAVRERAAHVLKNATLPERLAIDLNDDSTASPRLRRLIESF